ncbi:hypothetical protein REPUB_Repub11eG0038200 [Reevesia pubescens]
MLPKGMFLMLLLMTEKAGTTSLRPANVVGVTVARSTTAMATKRKTSLLLLQYSISCVL